MIYGRLIASQQTVRLAAAPDTGVSTVDSVGELPTWDLCDLYSSPTDPKIAQDLRDLAAASLAYKAKYEGKLASLDGAEFLQSFEEGEKLHEAWAKLASYAQLLYATDKSDPEISRFQQDLTERLYAIDADGMFYRLELNKLDDRNIEEKSRHVPFQRYKPFLDRVRDFRPHQLSDDLEKLAQEKQIVGRAAWERLYDETIADMRVEVDGKRVTVDEATNLMSSNFPEMRKAAAKALADALNVKKRFFGLVHNTLIKDKDIDDKWRDFKRPDSSLNLGNQIEDEVVDALISAVKASYPELSHRFYRLGAKWMNKEKLEYWDRNAPVPGETEKLIPWSQARNIVLEAYAAFSPELAAIATTFFEKAWIDAPPRPGKAMGAFAHPTVPSIHPYILLNYYGRSGDVMTLAHELGHGVHQVLAGKQGLLLAGTPAPLAETASVFGEMLTFRALLTAEQDSLKRKVLISHKVHDMLNTAVRQVSLYEFERKIHDARKLGELSADEISAVYLETQREFFGPAVNLPDDTEFSIFWSYIGHFVHMPFYVYAYAFGDCLVNSLYAAYQDAPDGFAGKYIDLLKAGGTKTHKELLTPFGLDASDPAFWSRGLGVIKDLIDELETL